MFLEIVLSIAGFFLLMMVVVGIIKRVCSILVSIATIVMVVIAFLVLASLVV